MKKTVDIKNKMGIVLSLIMGIVGMYYLVGPLIWRPNDFMMAFGGDAYVIYYDLAYHAKYGTGSMLTNMNYPYGEYLFMTDAEGSLAYLLMTLKKLGIDLSSYSLGMVHFFNIILVPIACLLMYLILRKLKINWWMSVIFGVLIIFMSPQMLRFPTHFGLAYPFIIPLVMWWMFKKWEEPSLQWMDALVFSVLLFFAFNNPYIGFATCGFAAISASLGLFFNRKHPDKRKGHFLVLIISFSVLLILLLVFHFSDPFADRVKQQWGFFFFYSTPSGFLAPTGSFLNTLLTRWGFHIEITQYERLENLGINVVILSTLALGHFLFVRFKKIKYPGSLIIMLAGALVLFLYTSNVALFPINTDWFEDNLGKLLMFKAVARLSWPLYFVVSSIAVFYMHQVLQSQKQILVLSVISLITFFWVAEIHHYIKPYFININHKNFLSKTEKADFDETMVKSAIDFSKYQAILCIPKLQLWSDKFLSETHWSTQFHAERISLFTGLPLINAMLSRQGIEHTTSAIQMLSDPMIVRERLKDFPNDKPILLVAGGDLPPLFPGELYVLSRSKNIFSDPQFTLYELPLDSIKYSPEIIAAQKEFAEGASRKPLLHLTWEDGPEKEFGFFQSGCNVVHKGEQILYNDILKVDKDTLLTFSIWTKIDDKKHGMGDFEIAVFDQKDNLLGSQELSTRKSYDIQDGWIRTSTKFYYGPGVVLRIKMKNANQDFYIDDMMIDYDGHKSLMDDPNQDYFLYDGFKVLKK